MELLCQITERGKKTAVECIFSGSVWHAQFSIRISELLLKEIAKKKPFMKMKGFLCVAGTRIELVTSGL